MADYALFGQGRWQEPVREVQSTRSQGQVAEFAETMHFREPFKSEDMPIIDQSRVVLFDDMRNERGQKERQSFSAKMKNGVTR